MTIQSVNAATETAAAQRNRTDAAQRMEAGPAKPGKGQDAPRPPEDKISFSPDARNRAAFGLSPSSSDPASIRDYRETTKSTRKEALEDGLSNGPGAADPRNRAGFGQALPAMSASDMQAYREAALMIRKRALQEISTQGLT